MNGVDQFTGYEFPIIISFGVFVVFGIGFLVLIAKFYKKVEQGEAILRNGMGGTRVAFTGQMVYPVIHKIEKLDITVKREEVDSLGQTD